MFTVPDMGFQAGKWYGPYRRAGGQEIMVLRRPDGTTTSTTRARWEATQRSGVAPNPSDLVVSVAGAPHVLVREARTARTVKFVCPECGALCSRSETEVVRALRRGHTGPFCTRSCAARHRNRNRNP